MGQQKGQHGQPLQHAAQPVQHEITADAEAWGLTKPEHAPWCWYSIGWVFSVLFFPVGFFIWCTIACNHFCQPEEVRKNHPADEKVARAALMTFLTWCGIAVLMFLTYGIYEVVPSS
eukprot:Skav215819  [mRNA]  locus=scaffold3449:185695:186045:+ [translate_table: standard]